MVNSTETPAYKARQAVAAYRAQCNEDVYRKLLDIIDSESKKGATKLSLTYANGEKLPYVSVSFSYDHYIHVVVAVRINVASLLDNDKLIDRFEAAGFAVRTMPNTKYGTLIDTISWE